MGSLLVMSRPRTPFLISIGLECGIRYTLPTKKFDGASPDREKMLYALTQSDFGCVSLLLCSLFDSI